MNKREILNKIIDGENRRYEYIALLNFVGKDEKKLLDELISTNYIEVTKRNVHGGSRGNIELTLYGVSEKGYGFVKPVHQRFWDSVKGDMRTVIVSVIVAFLSTFLTLLLTGQFSEEDVRSKNEPQQELELEDSETP